MKNKKIMITISLLTAFASIFPMIAGGCDNTDVKDDGIAVRFDYNDGVSHTKLTFADEGKVDEPAVPECRGYVFKHWSLSEDGGVAVKFPLTVEKETTLYAQWEPEPCSFTFNWNFAGADSVTLDKTYGETITESEVPATMPENNGMVFRYWSYKSDAAKEVSFPYKVKGDATVYAYWIGSDVKIYTVSFDANYEGASEIKSQTVEDGETVSLPTLKRTGYQFGGWAETKTGTTPVATPYAPQSDITLYAIWTKQTFTVSFRSNYVGAESDVYARISVEGGATVDKPETDPVRDGFEFLGWYTNESGGTQIEFPYTVTRSTSFYAHWKCNPVTATVFDAEFTQIDPNLVLPTYSGSSQGFELIMKDVGDVYGAQTSHMQGSDKTTNYFVMAYYSSGATLKFVINSSAAVSGATLYGSFAIEDCFSDLAKFAPSGESEDGYGYQIIVNGKELNYGSFTVTNKFAEFNLGNIDLKEGENVIELVTNNHKITSTAQAMAPCVDRIRIEASGTTLTWSPEYDNLDKVK